MDTLWEVEFDEDTTIRRDGAHLYGASVVDTLSKKILYRVFAETKENLKDFADKVIYLPQYDEYIKELAFSNKELMSEISELKNRLEGD